MATVTGPLRVSAVNPRYFTAVSGDPAGQQAVYLTGSHIWNNFHDGLGPGGACTEEPEVFDYLREDSVLECGPLESLARDGALRAYRHEGFWDCMDTYKDAILLNDLWAGGEAPWKLWA